MQVVCVWLILIFCSGGVADALISPLDTTMWNCFDLRLRINLYGQLDLTTNEINKTTYVRDDQFCDENEWVDTVFVMTNDFEQCPLQTCKVNP